MFYFYQHLDDDEDSEAILLGVEENVRDCYRHRWWYRLAHICRRWRGLILSFSSYLGLSLVCTYGTPVLDMLANSPPLPLVINFFDLDRDITGEDEEAVILALKRRRDRIRRIRVLALDLQKFAMAMEGEYPILECLIMGPSTDEELCVPLTFPTTFQAPRLRHLALISFDLPIGSRLLTTANGLVTCSLFMIQPSTYFQPNVLLQLLSSMPQLEMFMINFTFPVPSRDMGQQVIHPPITTSITHPNLRLFLLEGDGAYLEEVICRINTPRLERLQIELLNELTFSLPCLLHFIDTAKSLRFDSAEFIFSDDQVSVEMSLHDSETYAIHMHVICCHLDGQVSSVAQIFNTSGKVFTSVEHLALESSRPSQEHNDVDRTEWRKILRSFSNVKTLHVDYKLFAHLSRCLRFDGGEEDPLELLPELQELTYSGHGHHDAGDDELEFALFIAVRQNAGRPVTVIRS